MTKFSTAQLTATAVFPDDASTVPPVLDYIDALRLLRHVTPAEVQAARDGDEQVVRRLKKRIELLHRGETGLRGFRVGRKHRYVLTEVLRFAVQMTEDQA